MQRLVALVAAWLLVAAAPAGADWPQFGGNANHADAASDRTLNAGNVRKLHERWRTKLDAVADTSPIVAGNRLFETAKDGTTYALDAAGGRILWRFATRGPNITTAVPAFDRAHETLYVPGVDGEVHRLDPATGREREGGGFPVKITEAPQTEKDASPLTIAGGYLYAQTSGYIGDATPYVGHVVAIRLSDGKAHVFNSLCSNEHHLIEPQSCPGQRSGMWSRAGVVADPDPSTGGRIYVATGNGPFDSGQGDYGDSILALSADASRLIESYTPDNAAELEADDLDVGSSSPALLPRVPASATPLMAVQGGKDSVLKLLDRTHLGGVGHPLQTISLPDELFGAPAVWSDGSGTPWVAIDLSDGVHAYRLVTSNRRSRLVGAWHAAVASSREGTSPVESGGVLFVAASGALIALDAQTGKQLWNAQEIGGIHWESPAVSGGMVFCSDEDGYVRAFGL